MFYSYIDSQERIRKAVPKFDDGANVQLLSTADIAQDSRLQWAVERIDVLLKTFFTCSFPKLDVVWGVEDETQPNACVWGHVSPSIVLMTSGALKHISDTRARLITPAKSFAKNYAFPMSIIAIEDAKDELLAQTGENLGLFALTALFAHEVGHVHDRQFGLPSSIKQTGVLNQAFEITADTWAIRACCQLAIGWARDLVERTNTSLDSAIRASLFYALVGYGLVDNIDWKEEWRQPLPDDKIVHPPGALRLLSAAVSISEYLVMCDVVGEKEAALVAMEVFGISAQTLYWLQTGKQIPAVIFLKLVLYRLGNGAVISDMRSEYELFRANLP